LRQVENLVHNEPRVVAKELGYSERNSPKLAIKCPLMLPEHFNTYQNRRPI